MLIYNGDHAEFEINHENTPPRERPDWPFPSFDARDWAEAFCNIANSLGYKDAEGNPIDESWMISWFANALMCGHDEHAVRSQRSIEEIRGAVARGWCAAKDSHKKMDSDLAEAISQEIMELFNV